LLPVTQGHRDRSRPGGSAAPAAATAAPSARNPYVLQGSWIGVLRRNALEVAGYRVAACALRLEVGLTGGRAAHQHIKAFRVRRPRRARLRAHHSQHAVDVLGNSGYVGVAELEPRHALVLPGAAHDGCDGFPVLIAQRRQRAQQAGTALVAAAKVAAMTCG